MLVLSQMQSRWPRMGPSALSVPCASVRGALRPQASPFLQNPLAFLDWVPSQAFITSGCKALPVLSAVSNCSPHPIEMFKVLSVTTPPLQQYPFLWFPASGSEPQIYIDVQGYAERWEKQGPTSCTFSFLCTNKSQKDENWKVKNRKFKVQRRNPRVRFCPFPTAFDLHRSLPLGSQVSLPPKSKSWKFSNFFRLQKATLLWKTVKNI